jgi:hypothetical protein
MRGSSWLVTTALSVLPGCMQAEASRACEPDASERLDEPILAPGWRPPSGPCVLDPSNPSRLVLTTTDHSTGAVTIVDLDDGRVISDVAEGSTDAIPTWGANTVQLVHRHGYDYVELLDASEPSRLRSLREVPVGMQPRANPQGLVFGPDGLAFVPLMGEPWVEVLDLSAPPGEELVDRIDLSAFADADGNPDAGVAVACGDTMIVSIGRLDQSFSRVDYDALVAIDLIDRVALAPEQGPLRVRGRGIRQLRRDPKDPAGTTLLALTTGIERIDLVTQAVTWAVDEEAFAAAGIEHFLMPQAFDVTDDGHVAYVAAYAPDDATEVRCACETASCFEQVKLYRVGLDGRAPQVPEPFADGFDSLMPTLEVVGDRLWYGSTRIDAPGLWVFDLTREPPTVLDGPLPTGLAPYAMVKIP